MHPVRPRTGRDGSLLSGREAALQGPGRGVLGGEGGTSSGRMVDARGHGEVVSPQDRWFLSISQVPSHVLGVGRAGRRRGRGVQCRPCHTRCDRGQCRPCIRLGDVVSLFLQDTARLHCGPIHMSCWASSTQRVGFMPRTLGSVRGRPGERTAHRSLPWGLATVLWWQCCRGLRQSSSQTRSGPG